MRQQPIVFPTLSPQERKELRDQLKEQIHSLSFHAYEVLIQELLTKLGYAQARLLERTQWRQCTRHGGMDMEAYAKTGITAERIILQIKQYHRPVSRRFIDELRGVVMRTGAGQGVIITTSMFSKVAKQVAFEEKTAPIRLVDGDELTGLLLQFGVGVLQEESEKTEYVMSETILKLDSDYFSDLKSRFPETRKKLPPSDASSNLTSQPNSTLPIRIIASSGFQSGRERGSMLWRTHILAGMNTLWLLSVIPETVTLQTIAPLILLSATGSLLPDLDAVQSKIKNVSFLEIQPLVHVSNIANRLFGHRGALHSPISLAVVAILSFPLAFWFGWSGSAAFWLGYASHLAMDACTVRGISLFPFSSKRGYLLPRFMRIVTGTVMEDLVFAMLSISLIQFLLIYVTRLIS